MTDEATRVLEDVMDPRLVVIVSNVPDETVARRIAATLVEERLAACVNILSPCRSIYRWKSAIEEASEYPLLVKTTSDRVDATQARLAELHPYEVPEIVALEPAACAQAYLQWAIEETRSAH